MYFDGEVLEPEFLEASESAAFVVEGRGVQSNQLLDLVALLFQVIVPWRPRSENRGLFVEELYFQSGVSPFPGQSKDWSKTDGLTYDFEAIDLSVNLDLDDHGVDAIADFRMHVQELKVHCHEVMCEGLQLGALTVRKWFEVGHIGWGQR